MFRRRGRLGKGSPVHSCVRELVPPRAWALAPCCLGPPYGFPIPASCQLEDWALGTLLGLLRRWLPVPLRLLCLV